MIKEQRDQYRELERQKVLTQRAMHELTSQMWNDAKAFTHPHKPTRARIQNRLEETCRDIRSDVMDEVYQQGMYADPPDPRPRGQRT